MPHTSTLGPKADISCVPLRFTPILSLQNSAMDTLMAKPNANQLATLKVLVEQCQRDLDTLGTDLRLRQKGVIRSSKGDFVRVEKNIGELTHRIREYINMLEQ